MSIIWGIAIVLLAFVWIATGFDLARRRLGRGRTAAWLLVVLLLPFVGSLLYWIVRPRTSDQRAVPAGAHGGQQRPGPRVGHRRSHP